MHSKTKRPVETSDIGAITESVFGSTTTKIQELGDGMYNAAYLVDVRGQGRAVLKVAPPADVKVMTYERDIMRTEEKVYQLIRAQTAMPVPKLLDSDFSHRVVDRDWMVLSALEGIPWNKLKGRCSESQLDAVRQELGGYTAQMHRLEGPRFGYPADLDHPACQRWDTAFLRMVDNVLADGEMMHVELPLPTETIRQKMYASRSCLQEVTCPRLVHFDMWEGNIFLQLDRDRYRIEGIVDCERAFWGDPYADLVSNIAIFRDIEQEHAFLKGYNRASESPVVFTPGVRRRLDLYRAYLYLIMLVEIPYREYGEEYGQFRAYIARSLEEVLARLL